MVEQARILIVDDDPIVAESLADFLAEAGYATATAHDAAEALAALEGGGNSSGGGFGIVVLDLNMPR
ncbi:MAG: response regulator, partial [Phycisphaeraceae bacterium]